MPGSDGHEGATSTGDGAPRVLVLVKGLGLGGAERLIVEQVTAGAAHGVRYTVGHARPDKTHFVAELHEAQVPTVALKRAETRAPWPVGLARLLRRERPDVIHSHSPLPAAVARVLVRAGVAGRGARHLATEHNRWQSHRVPTRVANALTMALDATTWAVSDEARASVAPAWLRRRVTTLRQGVDVARTRQAAATAPAGSRPARSPEQTVVIQVANRRPKKAHEVMLDAFALAAETDPSLRLWLVGQWLDTPEFTALIERHRVADRIEVLGYRSDAPALIAAADVLALSSDHEGLPVAVMEAFALGRPVVATDVGGLREAVDDGVEGLLVPPRDPRALADALVRLARDPELRARLGRAALARSAEFDASAVHAVQVERYRQIAAGRPAVRTARGRRR